MLKGRGDLQRLGQYVESNSQNLFFATNGGVFMMDGRPLGLLIRPKLKQGSTSMNIRSVVGIIKDTQIVFAI